MDRTIVRFKIISAINTPGMISENLGCDCDRGWHVGELRPNTIIMEKTNGWILNSGLADSASLEDHIFRMLERLTPHRDTIKALSADNTVELSCVIYAPDAPALNFSNEIIAQVAQLGASLDIDLYLEE